MTANKDTFIASVQSANSTKVAAVASAVSTHLSAITAARNDVGYREGFPTGFATYDANVRAANAAKPIATASSAALRRVDW